ncbi:DUF5753 domain-containing protein [Actinokineospora guangxiensis]|uniref:DUF5753 domain-containing protein n=1 Tax=Actinokineospora guangxiensis TaxID=1490288 RepID=A0ABW0EUY3_9PSEU
MKQPIRDRPRVPLTPSVARRMLRFELERLIGESGVRHATVAEWLGVSRASVSAAIACSNLFSRPALEVLLNRLGESCWFARLNELLIAARRKDGCPGSTTDGEQRDADLLPGLEAFADKLTVFDPWWVPTLLRTQGYAVALAKLDSVIQNRAREQRQTSLLEDRDPLHVCWITSEHALHRQVGGRAVMDDQRAFLVELTGRPTVTMHVIPAKGDLPPTSPFQLVHGTPPVVVESSRLALHYAHDPGTVGHFEHLAEALTQRALSARDSARLLQEVAA